MSLLVKPFSLHDRQRFKCSSVTEKTKFFQFFFKLFLFFNYSLLIFKHSFHLLIDCLPAFQLACQWPDHRVNSPPPVFGSTLPSFDAYYSLNFVRSKGFEPKVLSRRIYSPMPLPGGALRIVPGFTHPPPGSLCYIIAYLSHLARLRLNRLFACILIALDFTRYLGWCAVRHRLCIFASFPCY